MLFQKAFIVHLKAKLLVHYIFGAIGIANALLLGHNKVAVEIFEVPKVFHILRCGHLLQDLISADLFGGKAVCNDLCGFFVCEGFCGNISVNGFDLHPAKPLGGKTVFFKEPKGIVIFFGFGRQKTDGDQQKKADSKGSSCFPKCFFGFPFLYRLYGIKIQGCFRKLGGSVI